MSVILPKVLEGSTYPGKIVMDQMFYKIISMPERVVRGYTTDRPGGKPIKHELIKAKPVLPRATGDERHNGQLMDVLQKALQTQNQNVAPMAKAQEQYRDWR